MRSAISLAPAAKWAAMSCAVQPVQAVGADGSACSSAAASAGGSRKAMTTPGRWASLTTYNASHGRHVSRASLTTSERDSGRASAADVLRTNHGPGAGHDDVGLGDATHPRDHARGGRGTRLSARPRGSIRLRSARPPDVAPREAARSLPARRGRGDFDRRNRHQRPAAPGRPRRLQVARAPPGRGVACDGGRSCGRSRHGRCG
jgi:hypothetical protein